MHSVIFLPGLMGTTDTYSQIRARITASSEVFGLSGNNSFEELVSEIIEKLPQNCVLCGHSFGSYLALNVALRAPERISGLVLLSSTAEADSEKAAHIRRKTTAWAKNAGLEALANAQADALVGSACEDKQAIYELLLKMGREIGLDVFANHQEAIIDRPDRTADLAKISSPTLLITGADDTVTLASKAEAMARDIPNAEFHTLDGIGHLLPIEAAEQTARLIEEFNKNLTMENAA